MPTPARLLFLNPDPRASAGCNISLLRLIAGLDRARFAPVMAAPADCGYAGELQRLNVPLIDYRSNNWWFPEPRHFYRHLSGLRTRIDELVKLIHEQRIDLVYTNAEYAFEGALAAAQTGKPHVWAQRVRFTADIDVLAHFPLSESALAELMLDLSDRIVVNSHDLRASFPDWVTDDKFEIIESGIAPPTFHHSRDADRKTLRERLGIPDNSFVVLAVSRISPEKDLLTWLHAAARLRKQYPDAPIHFVHVGETTVPPYFSELIDRSRQSDLAGHVHFLGQVSLESMPDIYQAADAFTLTSTRFEGFPRACAEATLVGLPVVSTRCGGSEDYLDDGTTGFLCDVGDDAVIAERIGWLIQDTARARAMGERGRANFRARYDESTLNAKWDHLFHSLTAPGNRPKHQTLKQELLVNLLTQIGQVGLAATSPPMQARSLLKRAWHRCRNLPGLRFLSRSD